MQDTVESAETVATPEGPFVWDEALDVRPKALEINTLPLTAALLGVAAQGISFATPGHRGGRSLRFTSKG